MCGRFTSFISPELLNVIGEMFSVRVPETVEPRYNIAPTQQVWVVRNKGDHHRIGLMRWGLIPHWAKDQKIGNKLINARSETVHEKPAFSQAIKYRRCIIPTGGFYEWAHAGKKPQPFYIHMVDGSPLLLAGLWESWKKPEEENILETFSILTTAADDLIAPLHDRMPVILRPEDCALWLSHSMHDPELLKPLYRPLPADLLTMYKVPDLVNNVRFDGPSCIARV